MIYLLYFFIVSHQADIDFRIAFNYDYDSFKILFSVIQQQSNDGDSCSIVAELSQNFICDIAKVSLSSETWFDEFQSKIICDPSPQITVNSIKCQLLTSYSFLVSGFSGPFHEDEIDIRFDIEIQNPNSGLKTYQLQKNFSKEYESMKGLTIIVSDQTAFTLSKLNIQYDTMYKFTPYTLLEVEFPPQDPAQPTSEITHINTQELKCFGIRGLTSQLSCTFSNNILRIFQTTPINENISYERVEFEIKGFLTKYITKSIILTVRTKIILDKIQYVQYQGNYEIETVTPYSQLAQLISSSDNIGMNNEIQLLIKINSFFDGQGYLELQLDLDLKTIQNIECLQNCITSSLNKEIISDNQINLVIHSNQKISNTVLILKLSLKNSFKIGTSQWLYILREEIDSQTYVLSYGTTSYTLQAASIDFIGINLENNVINYEGYCEINFETQVEPPPEAILILSYPNEVSFDLKNNQNIMLQQYGSNQLLIQNAFLKGSKQYSIKIQNIKNPNVPLTLDNWELSIILLNEELMKSKTKIQVKYIQGQINIQNANLGLLMQDMTTYQLQCQSNTDLINWTDLLIYFPIEDFIFESSHKTNCYLNQTKVNCSQENNIIKINQKDLNFSSRSFVLNFDRFPYPRSQKYLDSQKIKFLMNSITQQESISFPKLFVNQLREFMNYKMLQLGNNLQIEYQPSLDININETLIFQIEDSVGISNSFSCQNNEQQLLCNIQNNRLTIQVPKSQFKSIKYQIAITNFTKDQPIYSTILKALTIQSSPFQSSFNQIQHNSYQQSTEFKQFFIDITNNYFYQTTIYYMTFENSITIYQDNKLILKLPEQINFQNVICPKYNQFIQSCRYDPLDNSISFTLIDDIKPSLNVILLENVLNPDFIFNQQQQYQFNLSNYEGNQIQQTKINILSKSFQCSPPCVICPTNSTCSQCSNDYYNYKETCVKTCPNLSIEIDNQCEDCNVLRTCLKCAPSDLSLCIECQPGYQLLYDTCVWNQDTSQTLQNVNQQSQLPISQSLKKILWIPTPWIITSIYMGTFLLLIIKKLVRKQTKLLLCMIIFFGSLDNLLEKIFLILVLINYQTIFFLVYLSFCISNTIQIIYSQTDLTRLMDQDKEYSNLSISNRITKIIKYFSLYYDWRFIVFHQTKWNDNAIYDYHFPEESQSIILHLYEGRLFTSNLFHLLIITIISVSDLQILTIFQIEFVSQLVISVLILFIQYYILKKQYQESIIIPTQLQETMRITDGNRIIRNNGNQNIARIHPLNTQII